MTATAPQIGFDRFISLDWATVAIKVRAGMTSPSEIDERLNAAGLGVAARKKTRTVLNRLWLDPRPELADFAARGVAVFKADPTVPVAALSWGMALATYPFFGRVAELVGRLSSIQGDCSSAEIHRRMSEVYGEREGTYRMTNMVLQSQADWGAIERFEKGKRIKRKAAIVLCNQQAVGWLIEAALRYVGKAVSVSTLRSLTTLYPFVLDQPISFVVSNSPAFEVRSEGMSNQLVALRSAV